MRIAQVMLAKGYGGAERSFVDLCSELGAQGHQILAIGHRNGLALQALQNCVGVSCFGVGCLGAWDRYAGYRIQRALRQFEPALVQAHLARAALLGGRAARAINLHALAKTHNLVDLKYYRYLDHLVPTTAVQAAYLQRHGIVSTMFTVIPNFSRLPAAATAKENGPGPLRVRALGRHVHKKGFDLLLGAIATLCREGRSLEVVIAGNGPEREALERELREHDLAAVVRLPGWVDDVSAFLADADVFVLPSRDEPFGIVLLEAMASGVPIIATPTAGPREILSIETALILDEISSAAIARALAAVQDEPQLAQSRAERALALYRERYAAEVVVAQYLALYRRLLETPT